MAREDSESIPKAIGERLLATRQLTLDLAAPLSDADATIQPFPDASPAKWHLAHTTWFFETFVLRDHAPGYQSFDERYAFLFNSYYEAEGPRHARPRRGMLSRPSLDEVRSYRAHVDDALERALPTLPSSALDLIELGINHEQQHQELFLTDILATFAENPLEPPYGHCEELKATRQSSGAAAGLLRSAPNDEWMKGREGIVEIGALDAGFAFDSEQPRHKAFLAPHLIANRRVTNNEWREFIDDGGYNRATLWLSDGWAWIQQEGISGPLYWRDNGTEFTLGGRRDIDWAAPVAHVSYFEADAFARWAGARLPTEAEWEDFAASTDPMLGNQLDEAGPVVPRSSGGIFGDVWEWTQSAFGSYPGFAPAEGAVGEYNGKFMSGQLVLKGASCATPRGHSRASYRNFFPPAARWQFTGVRLARDA
jgi:ergothioneine biosynthesis protein EgtB